MPTKGKSKQQGSKFKEQEQKKKPNLAPIQGEQDRQAQQKYRDPQRKQDKETRR